MTEDEMKNFLVANADSIKAAVREKIMGSILQEYRWEIGAEVAKAVNEFVRDEIVPEVKNYLAGEKSAILAAAIEGARQVGNLITERMVEDATKNLKGGSAFRSIMETLWRGY